MLGLRTNQRRNISKRNKDKTGASTFNHDKAGDTVEQEAHHEGGLGKTRAA